jgi:WLM domain.
MRGSSSRKEVHIMALGTSRDESLHRIAEWNKARHTAPRIRDDISQAGKAQISQRQKKGIEMLKKASRKEKSHMASTKYGFSRIETLPMLPEEEKARQILKSLSEDPGILACMEKHKWNVGCLAEMYPEGQVGVSEVCLLGLNHNKGQKILLRLRTDDLKGFRKILNIRKVLFHELAHNVYSGHGGEFNKLMRQIEKECNELDWTRYGQKLGGQTSTLGENTHLSSEYNMDDSIFQGGTYRLGKSDDNTRDIEHHINGTRQPASARDLAAKAALNRLGKDREQQKKGDCGCKSCLHCLEIDNEDRINGYSSPKS